MLVFHATGNGGQAMESLIAEGLIAGVLDITTTELADELVGGVLSAGPERLTAAARAGVPQVVSVGATDMVNFHAPETVPAKFAGRKFYRHNPSVTLMRTTVGGERQHRRGDRPQGGGVDRAGRDSAAAARRLGDRPRGAAVRRSAGPRGAVRGRFARSAGPIEMVELDCHINDPAFAEAAAAKLLALMRTAHDAQAGTARL